MRENDESRGQFTKEAAKLLLGHTQQTLKEIRNVVKNCENMKIFVERASLHDRYSNLIWLQWVIWAKKKLKNMKFPKQDKFVHWLKYYGQIHFFEEFFSNRRYQKFAVSNSRDSSMKTFLSRPRGCFLWFSKVKTKKIRIHFITKPAKECLFFSDFRR